MSHAVCLGGNGRRVIRGVRSTAARPPAVTVVVPAYNYARYLEQCAHSVLTQHHVEVRLLIVDDCSTDDTFEVAQAIAAGDARVSAIRNERNRGHIATTNSALARVETEYVVKLDADDLLAPGSLARATALLEAQPRVGFVYGRPRHFSGAPPVLRDRATRSWTIWSGRDWVADRCRSAANVISQPEVVMRTDLLRSVGPIREDLPHTSDLHTWLALASRADVGRVNGPVQGLYRVHDASMQRTVNAGILTDLRGRRDAFDAALEGSQRAMARRALAGAALDRACRAYDRGRTGNQPVAELITFAFETFYGARELPEWQALARRQAIGAERVPRHPRFVADALTRRLFEELGHWRWLQTGEM
jgi:hypothetical protein